MKIRIIHLAIIILFLLLLLYTSISKLSDYKGFVSEMQQSPLLKIVPGSIAWAFPMLELITACMLATKQFRLKGLYLCSTIMAVVTVYVICISQFTYYIPCSCGGLLDLLPQNVHIGVNIVLLILAILGVVLEKSVKETYKNDYYN